MKTSDWLYGLNDPRDRWLAPDKAWHLVLELAFTWATASWNDSLGAGIFAGIVAGVLVEVWQCVHWLSLSDIRRAAIEAGTVHWPWMYDRASIKDLAADLIGVAGGAVLYSLV